MLPPEVVPWGIYQKLVDENNQLRKERDEADRRAGAAERKLAHEEKSNRTHQNWIDNAKEEAGYHRNVTFDAVWSELRAANARLCKAMNEIEELAEDEPDWESALIKIGSLARQALAGRLSDKETHHE